MERLEIKRRIRHDYMLQFGYSLRGYSEDSAVLPVEADWTKLNLKNDLECDSLDIEELTMNVERDFELDEVNFRALVTLDDVVVAVENGLANKKAAYRDDD
jgi:acyl carrier protein